MIGEKNYFWNGGKTDIYRLIRRSGRYSDWRAEVLKKNGYACRGCGVRGVDFHVDHIEPFAKIVRDEQMSSYEDALKSKKLWDITNGQTLCVDCHRGTATYAKNIRFVMA